MSLKSEFLTADAARANILEKQRECSVYTIATILPPEALSPQEEILRSYQSLGADGLSNLVSKLVIALFSPSVPWFRFKPSAKLKNDTAVSPEDIEAFDDRLYARELLIQSQLDSTNYRVKMRTALESLVGIGNSLTQMTDNWKFKNFRQDHWVQRRGTDGELLWLITLEKVDPVTLSDEMLTQAGLGRAELEAKEGNDRLQELYTKCERRANSDHWFIHQELNEKQVGQESEEAVSPYIAVGYIEVPGEDYSRGFIEERLADLRSLNGLTKAMLDGAVAAALVYVVVDEAKGLKPRDLGKPTGTILTGRVENGVVQGVGFVKSDKQADFNVAHLLAATIEKRLGKQMLLESTLQPTGERVTATQVMRIARELEGALGGVYAQIATELQLPLLLRTIYQMEAQNLLPAIPAALKDSIEIQILTGLEALGRQLDLEKLTAALQIVGQIPGAVDRISPDVIESIFQGLNLDTAKFLKTDEEMAAEREAAMEAQTRQVAREKLVETVGNIVENAATKEAAPAA